MIGIIKSLCCCVPSDIGACCVYEGGEFQVCIDGTTQAFCTGLPESTFMPGVLCVNANCDSDQGACCFNDESCLDGFTSVECEFLGGIYQGNATNCTLPTIDCFGEGACCKMPNSEPCTGLVCDVVANERTCSNAGGLFQGIGTVCLPNPCPQDCPANCSGCGGARIIGMSSGSDDEFCAGGTGGALPAIRAGACGWPGTAHTVGACQGNILEEDIMQVPPGTGCNQSGPSNPNEAHMAAAGGFGQASSISSDFPQPPNFWFWQVTSYILWAGRDSQFPDLCRPNCSGCSCDMLAKSSPNPPCGTCCPTGPWVVLAITGQCTIGAGASIAG